MGRNGEEEREFTGDPGKRLRIGKVFDLPGRADG